MANNDTKKAYETALRLEATVIKDAEAAAKRMTEDIRARKIEVIKTAKREAEISSEKFETSEKKRIQTEMSARIADCETYASSILIKKRLEIQAEVYDRLFEKLKAFASTDEYTALISKSVEQAITHGLSDDITVTVSANPRDTEIAKKYFPDITPAVSEDILLGGLKISDNARMVLFDTTLDYRFEKEKKEFLNISALRV